MQKFELIAYLDVSVAMLKENCLKDVKIVVKSTIRGEGEYP